MIAHLIRQIPRYPALLVLLLSSLGAVGCGEEVVAYSRITLSTGREIRLLAMERTLSAEGKPSLVVVYQTDIIEEDLPGLRKEIHQVWTWFLRPQVEQAEFSSASVVATNRQQQAWDVVGFRFTMRYHKNAAGTWVRN